VPFDAPSAVAGAVEGVAHPLVGLSVGGDAHRPGWLSRDLEGSGDLVGQQRRVPERRVEHQRADPQALGGRGGGDQRRERRGDVQMIRSEHRVIAVTLAAPARRGEVLTRAFA
jgi:hypothetical protein